MIRSGLVTAAMVAAGAAAAQGPVGDAPAPATVAAAPIPAAAPTRASSAAPTAADKCATAVVCRTAIQTGSLVAKKRTCLTRRKWAYVEDENQRNARDFVAVSTTK